LNVSPPTVSVILPVFNRLEYLRAAVASVFQQSFTDWELVIADDGSDDATKDYLKGLRHPQVKVLWLVHSGNPAAVRNAALRDATGEFVAFLDSDDEWLPDKLATQVKVLRDQPQYLWCYSPIVHIDADGNVLPRISRRTVGRGAAFERIARWEAAIAVPTVMVQRQLLERVGGFDEQRLLHEDYDLWLKLARESEVSIVGSALTRVRHHGSHYSKTGEPELRDWIEFYAKWERRVTEPRMRRVVERQGARCAALLARHFAARGDGASVFRTITRSVRCWTCPEWWLGNAIALARLVVPTSLVNASRRS
jgi:glycosyltransferase involved in cell wall biosynthesis